jgi:plastocyanin
MKTLYFALAALFFLSATAAQAAEFTVKMISKGDKGTYYFEPKELTVQSGDTVVWVNEQNEIHEVMSESVPKGAQAFVSPSLDKKGQTWSYTFTKSGTYEYHCHPHAALKMQGVVIVGKPSANKETHAHGAAHPHGTALTAAQAAEYLHSDKPVYSCPMHRHVFSDAAGSCPVCGMNLMRVKEIKDGKAVIGETEDMSLPMEKE